MCRVISSSGWLASGAGCEASTLIDNHIMTNHADAQQMDQRLIDLEIKLGFLDDLVDELNQVAVRQQRHIDLLIGEVASLRQQLSENTPGTFRSLRDELPPHY